MKEAAGVARDAIKHFPEVEFKKPTRYCELFMLHESSNHLFKDFFHETIEMYFKHCQKYFFEYFPDSPEFPFKYWIDQLHLFIESKGDFNEQDPIDQIPKRARTERRMVQKVMKEDENENELMNHV